MAVEVVPPLMSSKVSIIYPCIRITKHVSVLNEAEICMEENDVAHCTHDVKLLPIDRKDIQAQDL